MKIIKIDKNTLKKTVEQETIIKRVELESERLEHERDKEYHETAIAEINEMLRLFD